MITIAGFSTTFHVHKDVLCAFSDYFKIVFNSNFLESFTHHLHLDDVHISTMMKIFCYLYSKDENMASFFVQGNCHKHLSFVKINLEGADMDIFSKGVDVDVILESYGSYSKMESVTTLFVQADRLQITALKISVMDELANQVSKGRSSLIWNELENALITVVTCSAKSERKLLSFRFFIRFFSEIYHNMKHSYNLSLLRLMSSNEDVYEAMGESFGTIYTT